MVSEKKLKNIIAEIVDIDMGIYPKSISGSGEYDYEKRDEFKNGWNACVIEYFEKIIKVTGDQAENRCEYHRKYEDLFGAIEKYLKNPRKYKKNLKLIMQGY